jgi:hypothetical protein
MYTINIGLANPFTGDYNTVDDTLRAALGFISGIVDVKVSTSGEEPTVIIRYATNKRNLSILATALDQDCIALYDWSIQKGSLIGDRADQWGEFNPEYFQHI